jgi:hypothetical protein
VGGQQLLHGATQLGMAVSEAAVPSQDDADRTNTQYTSTVGWRGQRAARSARAMVDDVLEPFEAESAERWRAEDKAVQKVQTINSNIYVLFLQLGENRLQGSGELALKLP